MTSYRQAANRILVVDNDHGIRKLLRWTLEDEGLAVDVAADEAEAMDLLERERPDLLLLDVGAHVDKGLDVASRVRETYDTLPIVLMTCDVFAAERARRIGAAAYFYKPFEVAALVSTVKEVLAKAS